MSNKYSKQRLKKGGHKYSTAIGVTFIVLNIERWLKAILFCLFLCRRSEAPFDFGLQQHGRSKRLVTPDRCILKKPEFGMA
jgi:hypothetical protein